MRDDQEITRRGFHQQTLAAAQLALVAGGVRTADAAPDAGLVQATGAGNSATVTAVATSVTNAIQDMLSEPPQITSGVSSGDVTATSAVIWSRCDRPARMVVELSTTEDFGKPRRVLGPETGPQRDYTAKVQVSGLASGTQWFYRVSFQSLDDRRIHSEPVVGRFRTAHGDMSNVRFVWSADTAGQGFGIDPARGGMRMYATMAARDPDFLVHCGDQIYADNPFPETIRLDDGTDWRNITTPETSKVAETLDEFRANFRYNYLDEHYRAFHTRVPVFALWDDHETVNNWYPGEQLTGDNRFTVKSASLLASRSRTAFFEYLPISESLDAPGRIERTLKYGPLLELFAIDMRSYRGPNSANRAGGQGDRSLLGKPQLNWLKRRLKASTATWKVICSDMPLGLIVGDGPEAFEAVANGDGPPVGRELEIAELLSFLKTENIRNTVWLTGDVHYAASHHYSPERAVFKDFLPFWEFVSGPIHAGTFGPNSLDNTFGPEVRFQSIPPGTRPNRPPTDGLQFFGEIQLNGATGTLSVTHFNVAGENLWSVELPAE